LNYYNALQNPKSDFATGEMDLLSYANLIWRDKWLIMLFVLFSFVTADFYIRRIAVPLYPATAKIVLEERKPMIISEIESIMSGSPISSMSINTKIEVLKSSHLAGQLVDLLDLTSVPYFNENQYKFKLFNRAKSQFFAIFGVASEKPFSTLPMEVIRSNAINTVMKVMEVSNPRKTLAINISFTTNDAALSVQMANSMAELYIKNQIKVKLDGLASATQYLSIRTSELKQNFENLKIEMAKHSSQSDLVDPVVLEARETQLRELRMRLLDLKKLIVKKSVWRTKLQSLKKIGNLDDLISTADDFRLNHKILQHRNSQISLEELNIDINRFMSDIKIDAEREQEQFSILEKSESLLTKQIYRQSQGLIALQQIERETEAARLLYESFFKRLQEMNVQLGLEAAEVRLLSEASLMTVPSQKKNSILLFAIAFGLVMGTYFVIFREMRFLGYRSINELHQNSGIPVLGSVPLIPARDRKAVTCYLNDKPNSVVSASIQNIRTSILMSNLDQVPQVIMLTSSIPSEGKTTLTYSLAQNMACLGKKVLLIEADIRKTSNSVFIDRKKTIKLVDLLADARKIQDVNFFNEELGFSIITGNKANKNATDLFASKAFSKLITDLREQFEYIFIDTPPVLAVADARVIGANIDANIYIVEWNKTTHGNVYQGLDMLTSVGVNTIGLILNKVNLKKSKAYGYASHYDHKSFGSKYYEN